MRISFYNYDNVYVNANTCIFNIAINGKNSKFQLN